MGACFSMDRSDCGASSLPAAQVVSSLGDLREYNLPVSVSQVLRTEVSSPVSSSSSSSQFSYFMCNSDSLYYDDYIPALNPDHQLQPNQIYFVLPNSRLQQRLSASDMAALAVKASIALQNASRSKDGKRRKKARISPVMLLNQTAAEPEGGEMGEPTKLKPMEKTVRPQGGMSRSSSVRKLQRYTSLRAKMAVRSFRLRLSTIYEGTVL